MTCVSCGRGDLSDVCVCPCGRGDLSAMCVSVEEVDLSDVCVLWKR